VRAYDVLLSRDPESGWYGAEVPDLPGCYSQGETELEALENVREAIALYLSDVETVPPATEHRLQRIEIGER
jgi:predicted RNase H-like HicB family nuclease